MSENLKNTDDSIPILKRGQEVVDRLRGQAPEPVPKGAMPRIGVALGGGSARGLTHIPYIEAMDEMGLRPHVISGTSIGAAHAAGPARADQGADRGARDHVGP